LLPFLRLTNLLLTLLFGTSLLVLILSRSQLLLALLFPTLLSLL